MTPTISCVVPSTVMRASEDVRVAAESLAPERVAQDHGVRSARSILLRR